MYIVEKSAGSHHRGEKTLNSAEFAFQRSESRKNIIREN